ncbi:hypothetical protein BD293_4237 [Roseinatronobacter monicus]|uniref:Uncharacterized protein n=1 Tax=Roseinatronobacter monicus TaxID=393481 RepID=A0A543K4C9_9RHOB|nr:hypothetical protein BD293_4237 [Roseinatronobacter monicus]
MNGRIREAASQHTLLLNGGYRPGVSMVDLEESAGHAAPPQGGFEPSADGRPHSECCRCSGQQAASLQTVMQGAAYLE